MKTLAHDELFKLLNVAPKELTEKELKQVLATLIKGMSAGFLDTKNEISVVCETNLKIDYNRVFLPIRYMHGSYEIINKIIHELQHRSQKIEAVNPLSNTKH